jgi:phosphatidylethanolamine-binding protein (PEBP) family uncharacterized protein
VTLLHSFDFSTALKGSFMHQALAIALIVGTPAFAQTSLVVDWDWKLAHKCSSTSPALMVSGIPIEAKSLQVAMVDLDFTSFNHGGGSTPHNGEMSVTIPEGALKSYRGPCPPNFASFGHDYQFTVRALATDGQTEVASGSKTKTFSAKTAK